MSNDEDVEYPDDIITKLEVAFGKGFLSPGGQEEVAKIVEGIDLKGKEVLDIGAGITAVALVGLVSLQGSGHSLRTKDEE